MKRLKLTHNGKTQTVSEWSKETGIPESRILARHERGWTDEATLTTPMREYKRYEWQGKWYSPAELAKIHGDINASSMRCRLAKMSVKEALETPKAKTGRWKPKKAEPKTRKPQKMPVAVARRKINKDQCRACIYHGTLGNNEKSGVFCAYSLITMRCRKFISPPSPHCTVYVRGKSLLRQATLKQIAKGRLM